MGGMTACILLIRHAAHAQAGKVLSGRTLGLSLSDAGVAEAQALAAFLAKEPLDAVQASPVERAQRTAAFLARPHGLKVETVKSLDELDFGTWTGRSFEELAGDPDWAYWNACRSEARPPDGESMVEAQARALDHIAFVARRHASGTIAMVTHCDIIRAIVCGILGLSLNRTLYFSVDTGSVTRLTVDGEFIQLLSLNQYPDRR